MIDIMKLDFFKNSPLYYYLKKQKPDNNFIIQNDYEKYVVDMTLSCKNILDCLEQIDYSIEMLSAYRKSKDSIINTIDYIRFMIENFYIRVVSLYDKILRFLNVFFDIGLPEKECRNNTIIKNKKIKDIEDLYLHLKKIDKYINGYREVRNIISHVKYYSDENIDNVENYYFFKKIDPNLNNKYFENFLKNETDNLVKNKKEEFLKIKTELEDLLIDFFKIITPHIRIEIK